MSQYIDLVGKKFGRLSVVKRVENNHNGDTMFLCLCDCGNYTKVSSPNLRRNHVKSCGCVKKETSPTWRTKHGLTDSRIHKTWSAMKQRCFNKNCNAYPTYGGRGITVCDEWKNDFLAFYNWAIAHGYSDTLTIDRIDPNGNYEPSNCRWIEIKKQCDNRRNTLRLEYNGETHTIGEWSKIVGVSESTLRSRYYTRRWPVEKVLFTPINPSMAERNNAIKSGKKKISFWIDEEIVAKLSDTFSNGLYAMSDYVESILRDSLPLD